MVAERSFTQIAVEMQVLRDDLNKDLGTIVDKDVETKLGIVSKHLALTEELCKALDEKILQKKDLKEHEVKWKAQSDAIEIHFKQQNEMIIKALSN